MSSPLTRLWVLAALRRPLRAVVSVVALAVMSVAVVGSLVAADGLARLFDEDAKAEWGPVDVEARPSGAAVFDDGAGRRVLLKAGDRALAGAPRLLLPGASRYGDRTVQGLVLGLGPEEEGFPPLTRRAGRVDLERLGPDEALLNERLARRLGVGVGDQLSVVVAVPEWRERRSNLGEPIVHLARNAQLSLAVAGIVADSGTADLHRTPNLLVQRSLLQRATGLLPGKSNVLHLRAAEPGEQAADALVDQIEPVARQSGLVLATVKRDALDLAADEGGLFRSLLMFLALLVVLAAVLGVRDLFVALVRERGPEIAQLRASGAPSSWLARAVVAEGAVHGVVGAALGAVAAVPFAHALATALADHLASLDAGRGRERVQLEAVVSTGTVAAGLLLVLVTACLAAWAAGRRAVAAEPDTLLRGEVVQRAPAPRGGARPAWLLALGAASLGASLSGGGALVFLGITLLLGSLWLWGRRRVVDRTRLDRRAAVAGLVWSVVGAAALGDFSHGVQAGFGVITVAGELAVVCACVLLAGRLRSVMGLARLYAPRGQTQLSLLAAGAAAEVRRDRSAVGMAVVGGTVFGVVALSVLGSAAALPLARQGGGFDALGTSVAAVDPTALATASGGAVVAVPHADLPERGYRVDDPDGTRLTVPYPVRLVAASQELARVQQWGLAASLPAYPTAQDALTAVIVDGDKAVVDRMSRPEGAEPGDDVVLDLGGAPRRFRLIAVLDTFLLNGVVVGDTQARDTGLPRGRTLVLARAAPGTSPDELVTRLQRAGAAEGLEAKTAEQAADDVVAVNRSFTDVFAVMLALALLVAVVSMAAGLLRDARERRGELGVLRALGLSRAAVARLLAAEPLLVTVAGELVGLTVGLVVLRTLFASGFSDLPFVLDVGQLLGLLGITAGVALVGCTVAAWAATRRLGAEALADLG